MHMIQSGNTLTMTSREIAKLTGKQHKDVLRDIRVMIDALAESGADLRHVREDKDSRGRTTCFHLDKELTETLITGYSIPLRHKVIQRLHEMERRAVQQEAPQAPKLASPDALVDLAKLTLLHLPNLSDNAKQSLLSVVTQAALGVQVIPLPVITEHHMTATEVGEHLGISAAMVGRLANAHGVKTDENGETRLDKSRHSSKQVESFVYNAAGLERLREILADKKAA